MGRDKSTDLGLLFLRVFLFAILLYYGSQKMFGAFGGHGISGTLADFQKEHGFPQWLTMCAIVSEFFGSIAILIGLLTRLAALGVACTMAVASYEMVKSPAGYMGAHLPLALCGIALALILTGAGQFSLDSFLVKRQRRNRKPGISSKSA